jgi:1L-myo-inositol 1-phosphate cytidylyltransferase / CDP-L-myo-inositol myo-inositolphosphotransferase
MDRALILTTSAVFERPAEHGLPSPLTIVGGLSLFQRTILTLQRAGITHFMILAGDLTHTLREQLQGDRRVTAEVKWLPVREFPPSDHRTWEILSGIIGNGYIVAGTGAIFSASLIGRMREQARTGTAIVVTRMPLSGQMGESGLRVTRPSNLDGALMVEAPVRSVPGMSSGLTVDIVAIPEGFMTAAWAATEDYPYPLQSALDRGVRHGLVKVLPLADDWYEEVRTTGTRSIADSESVAGAEWTLLRTLKGPLDGFVDRYFNRKCSCWLTRWLLQTSLSPNAITVLATVVGLLAAGAFAVGSYFMGILGAVLFQFAAILDCCDGEVARLKFQESPFGEQLDIILDNLVHIALFAGIAWAASHTRWGVWALVLGAMAIIGNLAAFQIVQTAGRRRKQMDESQRHRIDVIFNRLVSRDFSIIILVFALIGQLPWFLVLAAIGSNIFWPYLAWQLRSPRPGRG